MDFSKKIQEAQISQANMLARFKETQEYQLLKNTLELLCIGYSKERIRVMRTGDARDLCLYYTGKEDAIQECFEAIDRIIVEGEALKDQVAQLAEAEEI
jgi:hypothetical protein